MSDPFGGLDRDPPSIKEPTPMPALCNSARAQNVIPWILAILFGLLVLAFLFASPAHAQSPAPAPQPIDGEVIIPWGDMLASLLTTGGVVYAAVLAFLNRALPEQWRVNEVFGRAVDYGFSVTAGAVKGKAVTLRTGSEVLEASLQYLVALAPQLYAKYGSTKARAMLTARIPFEEAAPRVVGPYQDPPLGGRV
jgi:hypothetical protein